MKHLSATIVIAILITQTVTAAAADDTSAADGWSADASPYAAPSIEPYNPEAIDFGKPPRQTSRKARRKIRIGGLMLGIGYAVPAITGLFMLDLGENKAAGARMLIPYVGYSEAGVGLMDASFMLGALMFVPSIVQLTGTGILISGISQRNRYRVTGHISAAPVIYREGGGGIGVSVTM